MEKKLIPITSRIKDIDLSHGSLHDKYNLIINYAYFIKQKLTLSMFVPCTGTSNVLELPKTKNYIDDFEFKQAMKGYEEVLSRVLFKGFEIKSVKFIHNSIHHYLEINNIEIAYNYNDKWEFEEKYKIIEDLTNLDLTLTESALKQLKQL